MVDIAIPNMVADFLLVESRERGEILTNLKLQKLLYYAQAWHLVLHGDPLFAEEFEAWVHGPVLPSQYFRFRDWEWRPILIDAPCKPEGLSEAVEAHLSQIVDVFGSETAVALELMTHQEDPWKDARAGLAPHEPSNNIVSKEAMRTYYSSL